MPSKSTFALVALLAATSVSALPRGYGYVNVYERDLTSTTAQAPAQAVPPVANAPAVPPVAAAGPAGLTNAATTSTGTTGGATHPHPHHPHPHHLQRTQTLDTGADGHVRHPHHHNANSLSAEPHPHRHHALASEPLPHRHAHAHELKRSQTLSSSLGNSAVPPASGSVGAATAPPAGAPPAAAGPTLSRREYYEDLVTRHFPHEEGEHNFHPHPHSHHTHHPHHQFQSQPPVDLQNSGAPPQGSQLQGRELLEKRGILEALGLKARVRELTPRQNSMVKEAQKECDGIASTKAKKTCHYNVEKIIQLTKETNHYVDEYLKTIPGGHNVFTDSDPNAPLPSSSTSSSSTSSSHSQLHLS